jgi:hypothetical protein
MDDQAVVNERYQTALTERRIADIRLETALNAAHWATILGLTPFPDGDDWCVLYGKDLQVGISGFGATPIEAIRAFDEAMNSASTPKLYSAKTWTNEHEQFGVGA